MSRHKIMTSAKPLEQELSYETAMKNNATKGPAAIELKLAIPFDMLLLNSKKKKHLKVAQCERLETTGDKYEDFMSHFDAYLNSTTHTMHTTTG